MFYTTRPFELNKNRNTKCFLAALLNSNKLERAKLYLVHSNFIGSTALRRNINYAFYTNSLLPFFHRIATIYTPSYFNLRGRALIPQEKKNNRLRGKRSFSSQLHSAEDCTEIVRDLVPRERSVASLSREDPIKDRRSTMRKVSGGSSSCRCARHRL